MVTSITFIDLIGALLSLTCTYLFVKADYRAWILSAIAIPFDAFVYFEQALYGDMVLQAIYFISTFFGWYQWRYGGTGHQSLNASHLSLNHAVILAGLGVIGIIFTKQLLAPYNAANVVWLDATTTVLSLCAQWLLCQKKIETWILWFIIDGLYFYLYIIKSLPFHGIMVLVYLVMAIIGWFRWQPLLVKNSLIPDKNAKAHRRVI